MPPSTNFNSPCAVFSCGKGVWPHLALLATALVVCWTPAWASYNFIRCGECDEARCPELHYCEGQAIKDHCSCCTVCSSNKFQPHLMIAQQPGGNACEQVKCPKLKVCVENMQGLPLCTCPNQFVCRQTKKREVCGTDGNTYDSRCDMRIASCNSGVAVRKQYRGACTAEDAQKASLKYRKKLKKKMKKRRRRRRRKENEPTETEEDTNVNRREEEKRKRRKTGNRKSGGKSRARRHRKGANDSAGTFDEVFPNYKWNA